MTQRRPTQKDVADMAGVSISAVSYALKPNSSIPLAAETKERIRVAAERLGYVPNRVATSLQSRSSNSIGVLLDRSITIPRYAAIVQAIGAQLRSLGFRIVLLEGIDGDSAVTDVRGGMLDGLVFIGHDDHEVPADLLHSVRTRDVPFVALDCGAPDEGAPYSSVDFDYGLGVRDMITHLAETGVQHVLYVRPDLTSRAERQRESALEETIAAHPGMTVITASDLVSERDLRRSDIAPSEVAQRAARLTHAISLSLREQRTEPVRTAIVCAWGTDVEAAYRAAMSHDSRLRVGALAAGTLTVGVWPGLSYSRLPLEEAGRVCARLIVRAATQGGAPERLVLAPVLETAPAPAIMIDPPTNEGGPQ